MQRRRVVLTGLGPATAFGIGIDPLWQALVEGRSGLGLIRAFDASGFRAASGAQIPDSFDVKDFVLKSYRKGTKVMARDIEIAVAAAVTAVKDAGLTTRGTDAEAVATIAPSRFGCHIGAGLIAADLDELTAALWTAKNAANEFDAGNWGQQGMQELTPLWLLKYLPNMLACHVTIIHDCQGPSNTITCNEASSGLSLAESQRVIERGAADACLSGGADSKLNPMAYLRQELAHRLALCPPDADATTIIRPFDATSTGSLVGEGGGILVFEELEHAKARGAKIYAEVMGQGLTSDGFHIAAPDPDGQGVTRAVKLALADAGIPLSEIVHLNAHATSTPAGDVAEANALRLALGTAADHVAVSATKSMTGHLLGGAGAIESVFLVKAIQDRLAPPTINIENLDPAVTVDVVRDKPRALPSGDIAALNDSFGFGGHNVVLVFKSVN